MPTLVSPTTTRSDPTRSDIHLQLLQSVRIASPCPARWEDMVGDDKIRHCELCNLNVHNLSNMDEDEVRALLSRVGGERVCAGMWKRADGTIITRNCPVGLAKARARVAKAAGRIAAAIGLIIGAGAATARVDRDGRWSEWGWAIRLRQLPAVQWARDHLTPKSTPPTGQMFLAGDIAGPASPAPPPDAKGRVFGPNPS